MTAIDRAALIEAAAKAIHGAQDVDWRNWGNTNQALYLKQAEEGGEDALIPTIEVFRLLAQIGLISIEMLFYLFRAASQIDIEYVR